MIPVEVVLAQRTPGKCDWLSQIYRYMEATNQILPNSTGLQLTCL